MRVSSIQQPDLDSKLKSILIGYFKYTGNYHWDENKEWLIGQFKGLILSTFPHLTIADISTALKWGIDGKITYNKDLTLQNFVTWLNYYNIIKRKFDGSKNYRTGYEAMRFIVSNIDKLPLTKEAIDKAKKKSIAEMIKKWEKENK